MNKKPIAVVTMVFNESRNIKRWLSHYFNQTDDMSSLYAVDHGSTDGSTDMLTCQVIKLDRSEGEGQYQSWRVRYISDLCNALLEEYEAVLYVDCDELVVADPARWADLRSYALEATDSSCNSTFGYDVLHDEASEPPLDMDETVLSQRNNLLFVAAMCKPTFLRRPVRFAPGFHSSDQPPVFGDLYRFHLRYADTKSGMERLAITRELDRPEMRNVPVDHQKISDETYRNWVNSWVSYPKLVGDLGSENEDFKSFMSTAEMSVDTSGMVKLNYGYRGRKLYPVPEAFKASA